MRRAMRIGRRTGEIGGRPVIERLTIQNYRVLRDVTFDHLTPLTVLLGPNGSGKSTVFDVILTPSPAALPKHWSDYCSSTGKA